MIPSFSFLEMSNRLIVFGPKSTWMYMSFFFHPYILYIMSSYIIIHNKKWNIKTHNMVLGTMSYLYVPLHRIYQHLGFCRRNTTWLSNLFDGRGKCSWASFQNITPLVGFISVADGKGSKLTYG